VHSDDFRPQPLPACMASLSRGVPSAPPGTIFVLGADGGYAVPPCEFTLYFGRAARDVHVAIGSHDPYVSRVHGMLACYGSSQWWLRNQGTLPMQLPGDVLLLSGGEIPVPAGYSQLIICTPLRISAPGRAPHVLEIHLVKEPRVPGLSAGPDEETRPPDAYHLSERERLVMTALAQRYLRQELYPQPISWKQAADDLNRVSPGEAWTAKAAAHVVATVRERLASGSHPVRGLLRDDGIGEPLGNTLNHNLIHALLESATLLPSDLNLLDEPGPP
jgi:hypothetical protein